eukprot:COSAG01_NODE_1731_length_9369_cov_35.048220_12_plen_210_part_00
MTTRAAMVGSVLAAPLRWALPSLLLSTCCGGVGQHDDKQTCTGGEGHQCLAIEATGAAAFAVLKRRLLERNAARGLERIQLAATARGRGLVATRHIRKGEEIFTVKLHAAIDCGEAVSASRSPSDLPIKVSGYPLALRAMRSGNYTEYALLCLCGQAPAGRPPPRDAGTTGADAPRAAVGQVPGCRATLRGRVHAARVLDKIAAAAAAG